ncbi:MAG: glycosyltransferase family 4 protein [Terracidiphilus sp.]|jgi:glycosyltransferase involved in cell wall biosynthesis
MKFAFISTMTGAPWGGSEELWSQSASLLQQEGHQVVASVVWWPRLSPKVLALAQRGIEIIVQPNPLLRWPVRLWRNLKQRVGFKVSDFEWLLRRDFDLVVISQGCNFDGLEWMKFCEGMSLPFAVIIQSNSEVYWPNDQRGAEMALGYRAARKVFCVSRHNLELLNCQIGESLSNAEVVWNPFNVPTDRPPAWPKENGVWKMACVGRLEPVAKGQDLLLQVLSQTKWRERPLEVNFYGAGTCEQNLKKLAARLQVSNLHFRGHVAEVQNIWKENHLLVMPSRIEGLPLALVEAMWCARPAVVTDVGGSAEICMDGETGFLVAAPAVGLLEQALEAAWDRRHSWESMGKAARDRVEKLVPRNAIGDFCNQLKGCVEKQKAVTRKSN